MRTSCGDNYLLSADYPWPRRAAPGRKNSAGWRSSATVRPGLRGYRRPCGYRDWEGLDRAGRALARSVGRGRVRPHAPSPRAPAVRGASTTVRASPAAGYHRRRMALGAGRFCLETAGKVAMLAPDGVGDDYLAALYRATARGRATRPARWNRACLALGDSALPDVSRASSTRPDRRSTSRRTSPFRTDLHHRAGQRLCGLCPHAARPSEKAATRKIPAGWTRLPSGLWWSTAWLCFTIFMEHQTVTLLLGQLATVLHTHSREETTTPCAPPSSRISTSGWCQAAATGTSSR